MVDCLTEIVWGAYRRVIMRVFSVRGGADLRYVLWITATRYNEIYRLRAGCTGPNFLQPDFAGVAPDSTDAVVLFRLRGSGGLPDLKRSARSGYDGFAALSGRGRHRI